MSSRFASGRLNTVYFTNTGALGVVPVKCLVRGESRFASTVATNSVVAADATVHTQAVARGVSGQPFDLNFPYIYESVLALLMAQINAALASDSDVRIVIDSLNDFDVMATLIFQDGEPYTFESRSGGVVQNCTFRFMATGPGA